MIVCSDKYDIFITNFIKNDILLSIITLIN